MLISVKDFIKIQLAMLEYVQWSKSLLSHLTIFPFLILFSSLLVLPENPIILDRWGRIINRTTIGPMEEGDDVILSCRVVGGKYY